MTGIQDRLKHSELSEAPDAMDLLQGASLVEGDQRDGPSAPDRHLDVSPGMTRSNSSLLTLSIKSLPSLVWIAVNVRVRLHLRMAGWTRLTFISPILLAATPICYLAGMARICTIVSHGKVEMKRRRTGEEETILRLGTADHVVNLSQLKDIISYNKPETK
jgi:hypothetical protein